MSVDKLVDSTQLDADLTSVANAIRTKGGTSASLAFPAEFVSAIAAIPSGGSGLKYATGTFTIPSDDNGNPTIWVNHSLGETPGFVMIWTEAYSTASPPAADLNAGYIYAKALVDMKQQYTTTQFGDYPLFVWLVINASGRIQALQPSSSSYAPASGIQPTATQFPLFRRGNSYYWRAGVTYKYFVSEKWWT